MNYVSTRGGVAPVDFSAAVTMGLGTDGGLLVPETVPQVDGDTLAAWARLAFPDLALEVMAPFVGKAIPRDHLAGLIRRSYAGAFLIGWSIILLIMTMRPGWLFIDIPSARIGAYLSFPLGLSAAFGIIMLFAWLKKSGRRTHAPTLLFIATAFAVFIFAAGSGSYDNSQTLLPGAKSFEAAETFAASRYLADRTTKDDIILLAHRVPNTSLHYSLDECRTWSDNVPVDDVGGAYPSMVNLKDGSVLERIFCRASMAFPKSPWPS